MNNRVLGKKKTNATGRDKLTKGQSVLSTQNWDSHHVSEGLVLPFSGSSSLLHILKEQTCFPSDLCFLQPVGWKPYIWHSVRKIKHLIWFLTFINILCLNRHECLILLSCSSAHSVIWNFDPHLQYSAVAGNLTGTYPQSIFMFPFLYLAYKSGIMMCVEKLNSKIKNLSFSGCSFESLFKKSYTYVEQWHKN